MPLGSLFAKNGETHMLQCLGCKKPVDELQAPASGLVMKCSRECTATAEQVKTIVAEHLGTHYCVVSGGMEYLAEKVAVQLVPSSPATEKLHDIVRQLGPNQFLTCSIHNGHFNFIVTAMH